jgi:hypothetical protein
MNDMGLVGFLLAMIAMGTYSAVENDHRWVVWPACVLVFAMGFVAGRLRGETK